MEFKNKVIAHRGVFNNKDIPENSLASFRKAIQLNLAIELDIQLTKDNVLVVFHDYNLKRMTGVDKNIQDSTYEEVKQYRLLNTNEKIPTLSEVLKLVHDRVMIDIEIKNTKRVKETCYFLLEALSNYHNFILKSFHPRIVRYLKKQRKDFEVGYLITDDYGNIFYNVFLPSNFMICYSKADFLAINKKLLKRKRFQKLRKKYPILVWTIKKKEEMKDNDIIFICNNLPFSSF